ncbi:PilW family protein [Polaromonas sp. SM01]|uniref:PilW family protein n=1 Tax=Polaromonas sp. SM01 TaxID=3085630 RepID=UPI002982613D|nr:PilW family protein [Polaromonas sp. SM01]MDW5443224.1 PilW family protein [Polaromonas sp. SM01]
MKPVSMRSRVRGLSLIELLISLVIGLVVVGAVLVSIIGSSKAGRFQSAYAGMNEDAQIGLSILSRDLQMAGYAQPTALTSSGGASPTFSLTSNTLGVGAFIFGCDTGFANPRAANLVCGASATPAFEVAYEADADNTVLTAGGVPSDCLGTSIPVGPPYVARNRYFISAGASGRPELYCASNNAAGSAQPLIENIENMKVWYGLSVLASPTQVVRYVTATDIAALGAVPAAAEWGQVISVRVCLLVRSAEPVLNAGDDTLTYLDCDSVASASNDRFLRRAYFTTASLRVRMPL